MPITAELDVAGNIFRCAGKPLGYLSSKRAPRFRSTVKYLPNPVNVPASPFFSSLFCTKHLSFFFLVFILPVFIDNFGVSCLRLLNFVECDLFFEGSATCYLFFAIDRASSQVCLDRSASSTPPSTDSFYTANPLFWDYFSNPLLSGSSIVSLYK
jgi:hypothetical protein